MPTKHLFQMDGSNGYEKIAKRFIEIRGQKIDGIGTSSVRNWIKKAPKNSDVLDLGCGTGFPLAKVLVEENMNVFGIDDSPTLVREFQKNFPNLPVACEAVENSRFFNKKFDAILVWGLLFLLSPENQILLLQKISRSLHSKGRLLFTAPEQAVEWDDTLTTKRSRSLGSKRYQEILLENDLKVVKEYQDEGDNHYFEAVKI